MTNKPDTLNHIYELFVAEMKKMLVDGKTVVAGDEVVKVSPDAATLNVIRHFLKDNNIGGDPASKKNPARDLFELLPFPKDAAKEGR